MFPGFILRPLYQTINSSGQQEKKGDMDMLKLTENNEVHSVRAHTHSVHPFRHPVVIVQHTNTPTHKTTPAWPGLAAPLLVRNNSEAEGEQ